MAFVEKLLYRAFGVPTGALGRIGGKIMAGRRQVEIAKRVAEMIDVRPGEKVLEIGFGPGIGIGQVAERLEGNGLVVGIDPSDVMLGMAKSRNAEAMKRGTVVLLEGTVERVPYADEFFDKAYAMNSFQLWPDQRAGLREVQRVLKPGGRLGLSFFGPAKRAVAREAVRELLGEAGFKNVVDKEESDSVLYVVARK